MGKLRDKTGGLYRTVTIASLGNRRRGKHHDLTGEILRQLDLAKGDMALVIPLSEIVGIEVGNLRSAVHRAAATKNLTVETQSDEKNFYVWASPPQESAS